MAELRKQGADVTKTVAGDREISEERGTEEDRVEQQAQRKASQACGADRNIGGEEGFEEDEPPGPSLR